MGTEKSSFTPCPWTRLTVGYPTISGWLWATLWEWHQQILARGDLHSERATAAQRPAPDFWKTHLALVISYTFPSTDQQSSKSFSTAYPCFDAPCNCCVLPWCQRLVDLGYSFQKLGCQPLCLLKFDIYLAWTSPSCYIMCVLLLGSAQRKFKHFPEK